MQRLSILPGLIFGLFFLAGGAFFLSQTTFPMWQNWVSMQQWQLEEAELLSVSGGDNYTKAHYRYQVNGATYTSDNVYITDFEDNIGSYHSELLDKLQHYKHSNQSVPIWVNPAHPQEAVIDRNMRWGLFALISGFCSIFILIGAVIIYSSLHRCNKKPGPKKPSLSELRTEWEKKQQDPSYRDSFIVYRQYRMAELEQAATNTRKQLNWKTRKGWKSNRINSETRDNLFIIWIFALVFIATGIPLAWIIQKELAADNMAILLALVFPLAGIFLLYRAVISTLEYRRFGQILFEMDPYPGSIGGHVGGSVKVPQLSYHTAVNSPEMSVRLECVYSYRSGGQNRSRYERIRWAEQGTPKIDSLSQGINLFFRFSIPDDLPNADIVQTGDFHFWRLTINTDTSGVDLDRQFNIPVFKTEEVSRAVHHDISAQVAAHKMSTSEAAKTAIAMGDFDIPGLSRAMHLHMAGNEIHMTFPMFRNKLLAIFAMIFAGGFGFASYSMLDLAFKGDTFGLLIGLFCVPFLIVALVATVAAIYLPFNNLRVQISPNKISVLRRLLFIPIFYRLLDTHDISCLSLARSGSTGQGVDKIEHYKLKAVDKAGKSITIAEDLDGEDVATHFCDYLAQRLNVESRPL